MRSCSRALSSPIQRSSLTRSLHFSACLALAPQPACTACRRPACFTRRVLIAYLTSLVRLCSRCRLLATLHAPDHQSSKFKAPVAAAMAVVAGPRPTHPPPISHEDCSLGLGSCSWCAACSSCSFFCSLVLDGFSRPSTSRDAALSSLSFFPSPPLARPLTCAGASDVPASWCCRTCWSSWRAAHTC